MVSERNWHVMTNADLEKEFRSDTVTGLLPAEAKRRLRHEKNKIWTVKSVPVFEYALRSFADFTTILLVLTLVSAALLGNVKETAFIISMMILCRGFRIFLYIYSQKTLENHASYALPRAKVVRGGDVKIISSEDVVVGDVVILDSGDTVPCDIRLTIADNIVVTETTVSDKAGITAKNAEPIITGPNKDIPISLRKNMLYANSVVVEGFGIGMAVAVGSNTLICKRQGLIEIKGAENIPESSKIYDWSKICSLSLVIAAFIITVLGVWLGKQSFFGIFFPAISMSAACLSEFLGAIGAFAWARALSNKKNNNSVFRNVENAEKAATADALVVRSAEVFKSHRITLHSYYDCNGFKLMGTKDSKPPVDLLSLLYYCTGISPDGSISKGSFGRGVRQTSILSYDLVKSLWDENGNSSDYEKYTVAGHIVSGEVDSDDFDNVLLAKGNNMYFAISGRADKVLQRCTYYSTPNGDLALSIDEKKKIMSYVTALKNRGVTVCAVGFRNSPYNSLRRAAVLRSNMSFVGFVAVSDRVENEAVDNIKDFRNDGGRIIVFSDGITSTVSEDLSFLKAEGIFVNGDRELSFDELSEDSPIPLESGKLLFVSTRSGSDGVKDRLKVLDILKKNQLKSLYVGYGVEDMWCFDNADASIGVKNPQGVSCPHAVRANADGISETEGGGFSSAFALLNKCRSSLYNLRNIFKYLIVSHVARLLVLLICSVAALPPFNAAYIVFWGAILDFTVSFVIGQVPSDRLFLQRKECKIPDEAKDVLYPTILGMIVALMSVATPFAAKLILNTFGMEVPYNENSFVLIMFMSCILAMPVVAADFSGGYGIFSNESFYGMYFILPVLISFSAIFYFLAFPVDKAIFPGWLMCSFSLLPTVIIALFMGLKRYFDSK